MPNINDHLLNPDSHEAPLVALLGKAPHEMSEEELLKHVAEVRALRGVAAKRTATTKKAAKTATRKARGGIDLDKFLNLDSE